MYKLYNVKAWGSLCVHFLLEEMQVPYTNIWMTPEQVDAVAQGRVWTGQQARAHGLVDALGGLETAVNIASDPQTPRTVVAASAVRMTP